MAARRPSGITGLGPRSRVGRPTVPVVLCDTAIGVSTTGTSVGTGAAVGAVVAAVDESVVVAGGAEQAARASNSRPSRAATSSSRFPLKACKIQILHRVRLPVIVPCSHRRHRCAQADNPIVSVGHRLSNIYCVDDDTRACHHLGVIHIAMAGDDGDDVGAGQALVQRHGVEHHPPAMQRVAANLKHRHVGVIILYCRSGVKQQLDRALGRRVAGVVDVPFEGHAQHQHA